MIFVLFIVFLALAFVTFKLALDIRKIVKKQPLRTSDGDTNEYVWGRSRKDTGKIALLLGKYAVLYAVLGWLFRWLIKYLFE